MQGFGQKNLHRTTGHFQIEFHQAFKSEAEKSVGRVLVSYDGKSSSKSRKKDEQMNISGPVMNIDQEFDVRKYNVGVGRDTVKVGNKNFCQADSKRG